jgi:hypothetical protein
MKFMMLVAVALLLTFNARAQQPPAAKTGPKTEGIRGPCSADAAKFCKDVAPGEGRIIACLEGNLDKLTPACQTQVNRAKDRQQARAKKAGPRAAKKQQTTPEAAKK